MAWMLVCVMAGAAMAQPSHTALLDALDARLEARFGPHAMPPDQLRREMQRLRSADDEAAWVAPLETLLAQVPGRAAEWLALSRAYGVRGEDDLALAAAARSLTRAVTAESKALALFRMADLYEAAGDEASAIAALEAGLEHAYSPEHGARLKVLQNAATLRLAAVVDAPTAAMADRMCLVFAPVLMPRARPLPVTVGSESLQAQVDEDGRLCMPRPNDDDGVVSVRLGEWLEAKGGLALLEGSAFTMTLPEAKARVVGLERFIALKPTNARLSVTVAGASRVWAEAVWIPQRNVALAWADLQSGVADAARFADLAGRYGAPVGEAGWQDTRGAGDVNLPVRDWAGTRRDGVLLLLLRPPGGIAHVAMLSLGRLRVETVTAPGAVVGWVLDAAEPKPVRGVPLSVLSRRNAVLASAKADAQGLAVLETDTGGEQPLLLLASGGEAGLTAMPLETPPAADDAVPTSSVVLLHDAVMPGAALPVVVQARDREGRPFSGGRAMIELETPLGVVVEARPLGLDTFGGWQGALTLPSHARAGTWTVRLRDAKGARLAHGSVSVLPPEAKDVTVTVRFPPVLGRGNAHHEAVTVQVADAVSDTPMVFRPVRVLLTALGAPALGETSVDGWTSMDGTARVTLPASWLAQVRAADPRAPVRMEVMVQAAPVADAGAWIPVATKDVSLLRGPLQITASVLAVRAPEAVGGGGDAVLRVEARNANDAPRAAELSYTVREAGSARVLRRGALTVPETGRLDLRVSLPVGAYELWVEPGPGIKPTRVPFHVGPVPGVAEGLGLVLRPPEAPVKPGDTMVLGLDTPAAGPVLVVVEDPAGVRAQVVSLAAGTHDVRITAPRGPLRHTRVRAVHVAAEAAVRSAAVLEVPLRNPAETALEVVAPRTAVPASPLAVRYRLGNVPARLILALVPKDGAPDAGAAVPSLALTPPPRGWHEATLKTSQEPGDWELVALAYGLDGMRRARAPVGVQAPVTLKLDLPASMAVGDGIEAALVVGRSREGAAPLTLTMEASGALAMDPPTVSTKVTADTASLPFYVAADRPGLGVVKATVLRDDGTVMTRKVWTVAITAPQRPWTSFDWSSIPRDGAPLRLSSTQGLPIDAGFQPGSRTWLVSAEDPELVGEAGTINRAALVDGLAALKPLTTQDVVAQVWGVIAAPAVMQTRLAPDAPSPLAALLARQTANGGFAAFEGGQDADVAESRLAADVLLAGAQQGLVIPEAAVARATTWLVTRMDEADDDVARQILVQHGRVPRPARDSASAAQALRQALASAGGDPVTIADHVVRDLPRAGADGALAVAVRGALDAAWRSRRWTLTPLEQAMLLRALMVLDAQVGSPPALVIEGGAAPFVAGSMAVLHERDVARGVSVGVAGRRAATLAWAIAGQRLQPVPKVDVTAAVSRSLLSAHGEALEPALAEQGEVLWLRYTMRRDGAGQRLRLQDVLPPALHPLGVVGLPEHVPDRLQAESLPLAVPLAARLGPDGIDVLLDAPAGVSHVLVAVQARTVGSFAMDGARLRPEHSGVEHAIGTTMEVTVLPQMADEGG